MSDFERAADAIVRGDLPMVRRLLDQAPGLARQRSDREHHSTLLHYVSANGVEDERQLSPPNIVEIARLLLDAGAEVDAESDAYGGHSTTLELVATSWPPEAAGVQEPLLAFLLDRGARLDRPGRNLVRYCLANGRGKAAAFLAKRGAPLDVEGAACVGRLDLVRKQFTSASRAQKLDSFAWACQFGHIDVVEFLLANGVTVADQLKHDGQTGLHWASLGGHAEVVRLLLSRSSPAEAVDPTYRGTPLHWAFYGWRGRRAEPGYATTVALLVHAGAKADPSWYEATPERRATWEAAQADPRMRAALRGEMPS